MIHETRNVSSHSYERCVPVYVCYKGVVNTLNYRIFG